MGDNCDRLKSENAKLRKENEELKKEIQRLLDCIESLHQAISECVEFLKAVIEKSDELMSGGGVPRGNWAYAKGAKETSTEAINIVSSIDVRC